MIPQGYHKKFNYDFGQLFCYDHYVIGKLDEDSLVTTTLATQLLSDIRSHYGKNKVVYISNREFGHSVDPKVYKLINPKQMIGIAIVGNSSIQRIQATTEQSLYNGSFGYFNNMESAVLWAKTFVQDKLSKPTG
ncbi:SpoIIAA family protein [Nonlabens xiamenensis]|uniref:STAS/SEC14 domain-containing protein n=1 Tax=Nonlabens xiamenensis TaxID=2341043 RepID=UPI000F615617|nr:STAS/SEC14 domain-containing protein [Nonlabens xiamenensis]